MIECKYGVRLSSNKGQNVMFFNSLSERMFFLMMLNVGQFNGSVTLIEKPEEKQEEI